MDFFDANCCFGPLPSPPRRSARTAGELVEEMDFCGVGEALALHTASIWETPLTGNELVREETRAYPRLHPAWALLPPATGELGRAEELLARMREAGVRALHAFPDLHNYLLNSYTLGPLLELMVEQRVPLLLHKADWKDLTALLEDFPELRVVQTAIGSWGYDRFTWPLFESFPHFYLEVSIYELGGGIETHCRRFGASRLLFGTNYPHFQMGGPRLTVLHADISEEDRQAIAAGNLRRLLEEVAW